LRILFVSIILFAFNQSFAQGLGPYGKGKPFAWYNINWVWYQEDSDVKLGYIIGSQNEMPVFDADGYFCDTCRQSVLAKGIRFRPFALSDSNEYCQPEMPGIRFYLNGFQEQDCDHRFDTIYQFIGGMTYYKPDRRFCNADFFQTRETKITYLSDSLLSVEVKLSKHILPDNMLAEMQQYRKALGDFNHRQHEISELKNEKKRAKLLYKLYQDTIHCPHSLGETNTHPYYRKIFKSGNKIGDNYRWIFLKDTMELHQQMQADKAPYLDSVTYRALVFNPYHPWKEVKLDVLFGDNVYKLIEEEMATLTKQQYRIPFNQHHYEEQNKRRFMWGLEPGNLVIYYGNEGEFGAYAKHRIPFDRLFEHSRQ
jgi:hypothetical protein